MILRFYRLRARWFYHRHDLRSKATDLELSRKWKKQKRKHPNDGDPED